MAWSVEYDSEHDLVQAVYAGHVTADDFKNSVMRTIECARKHKTLLLLIDDSKLESAVSTSDIFEMPLFYEDVEASRRSRIALIIPGSGKIREDVKFYVTVCRNRGWFAEAFDHRQEAIDWLLKKPGARKSDADDG